MARYLFYVWVDASFLMVVFLLTKLNFSLHHVIFWALKPAMRIWSPKSSPRGTFAHHQCRRRPPPPPPPPPPPTPAKHPPPAPLCIVQLSCTGLSHGGGVVLRMSPNHIQVDFRDHHFLFPNCTFVVLRRFASLPASPPPPPRARAPTLGVESELHLLA